MFLNNTHFDKIDGTTDKEAFIQIHRHGSMHAEICEIENAQAFV